MREEGLRIRCSQPLFFVGSHHSMLKSPPSRAGPVFGPFGRPERGRSGGCRGRLFEAAGGFNVAFSKILRSKFRKRLPVWFWGVVR